MLCWLVEAHDGSVEQMHTMPPDVLRQELLAINGVGPETADSILLYAGGFPTFVVDSYAQRGGAARLDRLRSRLLSNQGSLRAELASLGADV